MKKFLLTGLLFALIFIPVLASAAGLVPCGNPGEPACTIGDFFEMLARIYNFIVYMVATPLAIIALIIGGIFIMISAGNPKLLQTGKDIFGAAVWGLVLVFCSWIIINFIMTALGYTGAWNVL